MLLIHCAIPAGGLSLDHCRWIRPRYPFFLRVKILSRVFRGKFLAGLKRLYRSKKLSCAGPAVALADSTPVSKLIRRLHRHDWVVYAKPAFGGPLQGVAISGPLHSPRGHFQSSLVGLRARARQLPLEGLRPRWQARPDDPGRHGVLTAL